MTPSRIKIADVTPAPDDEIVAAITMALHEAWPQETASPPRPDAPNAGWRFGDRRWRERQIPRQTWGMGR